MMIEPTETESLETIDSFIEVMIKISEEAKENPEILKTAPHNTLVRRLDEVKAARNPILKWSK
jgi:glycine dehydrogenase subunit 2